MRIEKLNVQHKNAEQIGATPHITTTPTTRVRAMFETCAPSPATTDKQALTCWGLREKMVPFRSWGNRRSVEEDAKQRVQQGGSPTVRSRVRRVATVVENAFSPSRRKEQQQQRQQQQQQQQQRQQQQKDEDQQQRDQQEQQKQPLGHDENKGEKDGVVPHTIDLRRSRTISASEMSAVLKTRELIMERRLSLPLEHPRSVSTEEGHTDHEDSDNSGRELKPRRPESIE